MTFSLRQLPEALKTLWIRQKGIFLNQLWKEWELLKVYWVRLLCLVFIQWAHAPMTALVYYLYDRWSVSKDPLLEDLGFRMYGERLNEDVWGLISTTLTFILLAFSFIYGLSPFFIKKSKHYATHYITRFLMLTSISILARIVSFLSTILPSPDNQCRFDSPLYNPPSSVGDFLLKTDTESGCADLIFSSHTMYSISSLYIYWYYGRNRYMTLTLLVSAIFNSLIIIGLRRHYSVDVWLAWYCVSLLFLVLQAYYKDIRPRKLSSLERNDNADDLNPSANESQVGLGIPTNEDQDERAPLHTAIQIGDKKEFQPHAMNDEIVQVAEISPELKSDVLEEENRTHD